MRQIADAFVHELEQAAKGKKTSLVFLKNPLPGKPVVDKNELFQVLVVGGSTFWNALVRKGRIIKKREGQLPFFKTEDDFLRFFASQLSPKVNIVVCNFAYPLKPLLRNGILDGRMLLATKEHSFGNLVGKVVGKTLEEYIFAKTKRRIQISVVNDTPCLVLAGLTKEKEECLVGGIVGTGMNFGFFLENKQSLRPYGLEIVNLEAGSFDKFTPSKTGMMVDKRSGLPGKFPFLKETAGAYLYQHFNLLSDSPVASTEQMSKLAEKGNKTARELLRRSAMLIACQIAGIYKFKKQPRLTFVMEGSLFWKGWKYREMVEKYLGKLGVSNGGIRFMEIKDSAVVGAAALVSS